MGEEAEKQIVNSEQISSKIYEIRGQKVMLDSDLAQIYGYSTKDFNNNAAKFDSDFRFQLTKEEFDDLRRKNSTSSWGDTGNLPYVFTEQGIYMIPTVLGGILDIEQSMVLIRIFKQMKNEEVRNLNGQQLKNSKLKLNSILKWLQDKCSGITGVFKKNSIEDYGFGPVIIDAEEPAYENVEELERNIENKNIFNIALSGPYGSGKSSVVATLVDKIGKESCRKNNKFLIVTLANLGEKQNSSVEIEKSILQQILYKEKATSLKNSQFKRINKNTPWWQNFLWLVFLFLLSKFVPKIWFLGDLWSWLTEKEFIKGCNSLIIDGICFVLLLLLILWFIHKKRLFYHLNSLSVKGITLELENQSVLNKNIAELIYFFSSTSYDVVIFEDLDRFNNTNIFNKLREINYLLNNSKDVGKKVTFVYAVKDDLFTGVDRTKFFDAIVSVIPVVDGSNVVGKIKEELERYNENAQSVEIKEQTFFDLAPYITELRQIKAIVSDYECYKKRVNHHDDYDHLFAMMVFKNCFPKEFSELQNGGEFRDFLEKKEADLRKEAKDSLYNIIARKRAEVEQDRNFMSKNINDEMKVELASSILRNLNLVTNDSFRSFFQDVLENRIKDIEPFREKSKRYGINISRIENINYEIEKRKKEKEDAIRKLDEEIERIDNANFSSLFQRTNIPYDGNENYRKILQLFKYGYINEHYYNFMSYKDSLTLCKEDAEFLDKLCFSEKNDWEYQPHNIVAVIRKIPKSCYNKKNFLNIFILAELLKSHSQEESQTASFLIRNAVINKQFEFFSCFGKLQDEKVEKKLFGQLSIACSGWFSNIKDVNNESERKYLYRCWLKYFPFGYDNAAMEWLKDNYSFLSDGVHVGDLDIEKVQNLIVSYKCLFAKLDDLNRELLDFVIKGQWFEINRENMQVIVPYINRTTDPNVNMTRVLKTGNEEFKNRIWNDFEYCIENVFTDKFAKEEDSETLGEIIRRVGLTDKTFDYLSGQANTVAAGGLNPQQVEFAIKAKILEPNWTLLYDYLNPAISNQELKKSVTGYIAHFADKLSGIAVAESTDKTELLKRLLTQQPPIKKDKMELLLRSFQGTVLPDKFIYQETYGPLIVKHGCFNLTQQTFNTMSQRAVDGVNLGLLYIENNTESFFKSGINCSVETYKKVFESEKIDNEYKIKILGQLHPSTKLPPDFAEDVLDCIKMLNDKKIVTEVLWTYMINALKADRRIEGVILYVQSKESVNANELLAFLNQIGPDYAKIVSDKSGSIVNTQLNKQLLEALKTKLLIYNYKVNKEETNLEYTTVKGLQGE